MQRTIPGGEDVNLEEELFEIHPPRNAVEDEDVVEARVYAEPVSQLRRNRHIASGVYTRKASHVKDFFPKT